jgi:hypothetical protein
VAYWWDCGWQGKSSTREESDLNATLSTANRAWNAPELNPGLPGMKPVIELNIDISVDL